jgi:RHS repeat-associated protein
LNRLVQVIEHRNNAGSGDNEPSYAYRWTARYDGKGRRVLTTTEWGAWASDTFTPGTGPTYRPTVQEESWYDPMREFLEIAVLTRTVGGASETAWKIHGPDANGAYGGLQGIGGLEAIYTLTSSTTTTTAAWTGVVDNYCGHIVAYVDGDGSTRSFVWHRTLSGGYGPRPDAPVFRLSEGAALVHSTAWRGKRQDISGFYYLGARYYEPTSGRFLSPDPFGHGASMSLYDYAGGDPVNFVDPTGRELEWGIKVGVSMSWGGPKTDGGTSVYMAAAVSERGDYGSVTLDASMRLYNGGVGTPIAGPHQGNWHTDASIGITGTIGYGTGPALTPNTFNTYSPSALPNTFQHSASYGQHLVYNSAWDRGSFVAGPTLRVGFGPDSAAMARFSNDTDIRPNWGLNSTIFGAPTDGGWTGTGEAHLLANDVVFMYGNDSFTHDRDFTNYHLESFGEHGMTPFYNPPVDSPFGVEYNRSADHWGLYDSQFGSYSGNSAYYFKRSTIQDGIHLGSPPVDEQRQIGLSHLPLFTYPETPHWAGQQPSAESIDSIPSPRFDPTGKMPKNGW